MEQFYILCAQPSPKLFLSHYDASQLYYKRSDTLTRCDVKGFIHEVPYPQPVRAVLSEDCGGKHLVLLENGVLALVQAQREGIVQPLPFSHALHSVYCTYQELTVLTEGGKLYQYQGSALLSQHYSAHDWKPCNNTVPFVKVEPYQLGFALTPQGALYYDKGFLRELTEEYCEEWEKIESAQPVRDIVSSETQIYFLMEDRSLYYSPPYPKQKVIVKLEEVAERVIIPPLQSIRGGDLYDLVISTKGKLYYRRNWINSIYHEKDWFFLSTPTLVSEVALISKVVRKKLQYNLYYLSPEGALYSCPFSEEWEHTSFRGQRPQFSFRECYEPC